VRRSSLWRTHQDRPGRRRRHLRPDQVDTVWSTTGGRACAGDRATGLRCIVV
jgi:hypothetical protein